MRLYIYHRFSTFHINTNKMGIKIHVCLQVLLQGKWRNYKTREIQEWEQNIEEDISAGTIAFQQRKEGKKTLHHSPQDGHIVHILISLAEHTRYNTSHWIVSSVLEVNMGLLEAAPY